MESAGNRGPLILVSGATGNKGERWREVSLSGALGSVRSDAILRSRRRRLWLKGAPRSYAVI